MHPLVKIAALYFALSCAVCAFAEEYKIGAVLALTGAGDIWSDNAKAGMELAVDEINAKGGVGGRKLKIIYEDSNTQAARGVSGYRKLVHQDKVEAVVGDVWGFLTIPLIPLSARDKVVLISPTVMDHDLPEQSAYFFSFGHRFSSLEKPMQRFLQIHPAMKTAGTLSFRDYWNDAFVGTFSRVASKNGVVIGKQMLLNDFTPDFRSEVTMLRQAKVDCVLSTWRCDTVLTRMREQHFAAPFLCSSDAVEALRIRAKDAELFEGTYFIDWAPSKSFKDMFYQKYQREAAYEAHNSYDLINAIVRALERPGKDLREKLLSLSFAGTAGRVDFAHAPFVNLSEGTLYKIVGGRFEAMQ